MRADRLLFFGAALAYLAATGHPSAWLAGLPLGSVGIAAGIALAAWAIGLPGAPPRARLVAALLVGGAAMKLLLAGSAPPYGLLAEYRAGGLEAMSERSTEWRKLGANATRVDTALDFRGDEFPVHFFNDAGRFNYFSANQPRRDMLPFAARWTGRLWAPEAGRYRFVLEANGRATLDIPGLVGSNGEPPAVASGQRVHQVFADADLSAGLHPIEVRYARPREAMPWLVVRGAEGDAELLPLAAPVLVRDATDVSMLRRDRFLGAAAVALDLATLALLLLALIGHARSMQGRAAVAPGLRLERTLLALFAAGALGIELASHGHLAGRTTILSGGNDWLAYEGFARNVLLDGPLLAEGRALGQGQPYYYQPLYIYWLALTHVVFGEGLIGPLFANAALGVAAGLLVYLLSRELFGRAAAAAALLVFTACRATFFAPTTGLLLSENLLIPLIPPLLLLLVRAARTGSLGALAGAGVVLGLAGLTRTTPLALLPPALIILALAFRRLGLSRRSAAGRLALVVVVCLLTISPATARNYVVAGRLVPITSSAGANLWEAHRPTARVDLARIDRDPLYNALGLDRKTREVAEFIRQDPVGYGASLAPMGLYAVGVVGVISGTPDIHPGLLAVWLAYVLTTLLLPAARRLPTWFLHALIWSHLAQMMVFFSHQYGFRLILPMYVAMMPIVGLGVSAAVARTRSSMSRRLGPVETGRAELGPARGRAGRAATIQLPTLALAAIAIGSSALLAAAPSLERARESFYGLSGDAAIASRLAARPELLQLADAVYFVGDDSRSSAVAYLRGLAYPTVRWFDGARGFVLPPRGERALYVLPDRAAADFGRRCLGDAAIIGRELDGPTRAWVDLALAGEGDGRCGASQHGLDVPFEGVARLIGFDAPGSAEPGQQIEITVRWEALATPANRSRPFVRLIDRRGRIAGRGSGEPPGQVEVAVYPSASWQPGEVVIGTARLEVDPTLAPGDYFLEVGFATGGGLAAVADDSPSERRGQPLVRGGTLRLVSRSTPLAPEALPITLPVSAQFGGVRLLGAALDGEMPRPGDLIQLTLFWQNVAGRLPEQEVSIVLRDESGGPVQAWREGPVDGTYPTTVWKPGEIVRDRHSLIVPASAPPGPLELAVGLAGPGRNPERYEILAPLNVRPIARQFAQPSVRTLEEARFENLARLVGYELKDRRVRPGDGLELTLLWQALAESPDGSTVSLRLRAADGRTLARHDAAPANGRRPTTGWLPGEFVEDEHRLQIPRQTPRGRYRLAVSMYRSESWQPLLDGSGAEQVILGTEVVVE